MEVEMVAVEIYIRLDRQQYLGVDLLHQLLYLIDGHSVMDVYLQMLSVRMQSQSKFILLANLQSVIVFFCDFRGVRARKNLQCVILIYLMLAVRFICQLGQQARLLLRSCLFKQIDQLDACYRGGLVSTIPVYFLYNLSLLITVKQHFNSKVEL